MYRVTLYDNPYETNGIVIHHPNVNGEKVEGTIKDEINKIDTFTFGMTIENKGYGKIKPFQSFITVLNTKNNKKEFKGRVYGPNESMDETGMLDVSYTCEGEVSYLTDSQQRHLEFRGTSTEGFKTILDYHNTQVEDYKRFEVGVVEVHDPNDYMYFYLSAEKNTWDSIFEKLINKLGGELQIRYENGVRYLDWLETIGYDSKTEIRLAKNLMSVNRTVDPSEIVTRLTPLGNRIESEDETATDASEARLTIESVNSGKPYIDRPDLIALFGIIGGSQTWDGVTTPQRLLTNGISWLDNQKVVLSQHQIGALDLASIGLDIDFFEKGNTHHVKNPIMAIDERLRIIGTQKDINEPENSNLIVGDKFLTGTEYQVRAMQSSERVAELQGRLDIQSSQVVQLRSAYAAVNSEIEQVQTDLTTVDIRNLPIELQGIHNQISELQTALLGRSNPLRVATFNIWQSRIDIEAYKNFALSNRLDIIGLQEVLETTPEQLKTYGLNNVKYEGSWYNYGNAIQSRFNLAELEVFELPGESNGRRILIKTSVEFEGKTISVYNTHLNSQEDDTVRLQQLEFIKQTMNADTTKYKILTGDFNVQDKAHYDLLGNLKSAQGHNGVWHDTWDVNIEPWNNGAIDNILVTPNIDILKVEMPLDKLGSDHYMLWAEIALK